MSVHSIDDSFAADLPYGHFTADGEMFLRGRGMMVAYNLRGLPVESASREEVSAACERLGAAFRHLGDGDMVHAQFHRQPVTAYPERQLAAPAARLIDAERRERFATQRYWRTIARLYVTTQDESALQGRVKTAFFSSTQAVARPAWELRRERFLQRITNFQDVAGGVLGSRLSSAAMLRDLFLSVNCQDYPVAVPNAAVRLNEIIGSERFYGGVTPAIGDYHLRPVCITAYPADTVPQMLAALLRDPGPIAVSARFICQDVQTTQEQLQLENTFWLREQLGGLRDILERALNIPRRRTTNQQEEAQIAEIDEAIAAAAGGLAFGWCSIIAKIMDHDPDRATLRARELVKYLSALGIVARLEDANAVEAIMCTWPGDGWSNVRAPIISAANFAELIFPVERWSGTPTIDSPFYVKDTPAPLVCGGSGAEPFYLPTHLGGVANQLIIGPTGTGKSALLGVLVAAATALPEVRIVWLDLDYSSFVLAHALGADYRELAADESSPLCPLVFLNDEIGMSWLFDWLSRLFARWQILLDERQAADLTRALTLAQSQGLRTVTELLGLVQDSRLRAVLSHYAAGGKWGHIFGGEASAGEATTPLSVLEMRGLVALGDRAAAPATELILHGVENGMGARPCFIYVDEAWRMLSDEISRDWLYDAIRTFRKRNAGITLATQSLTEIANSPYRDLLLESCPGKIFLPNPEAKGDYVRAAYLKLGLSEKEIAIVAAATPRKEYFFHCAQGRRLFTLDLGPVALALCTATGHQDVAQARALLEQHGAPGFLNAWLAARANGANSL